MPNLKTTGDLISAADWNAIGGWNAWSPTYTNLTVGNGTVVARYADTPGGVIVVHYSLVFGSTSSVDGSLPTVSVPVAAAATYNDFDVVGEANLDDSGVGQYWGRVRLASSISVFQFVEANVSGSNIVSASVTATSPFTWTTGDTLQLRAIYEAA